MNETKEIWKEIYSLAKKLEIGHDRLNTLVTEILGKRAETEEEAKKILKFLRAVDEKPRFLTVEQAIDVTKAELIEAEPIEESGEEVEAEAEVVEPEEKKEEKWDKTVRTEDGKFMFRLEGENIICKNAETGETYVIDPKKPKCSCPDFQINKKGQEWCKHLKAADAAGYGVTKLEMPEEIKALAKPKKKRAKAKEEEIVTISILDKQVQVPIVQTPDRIIQNEDAAAKMLKDILGEDAKYEDVIEKYGDDIEEIKADVVISLAQYAGIRFVPVNKETESTKINIGKLYLLSETDEKKRQKYAEIADLMPDTEVVMRCKVTAVAAWKDQVGNIRVGVATKEEHMTPFDLRDICRRGSNFIETKAESKAYKKAILVSLPITHDGLKRKIKKLYHWMEK